jgi:hypothetical protein
MDCFGGSQSNDPWWLDPSTVVKPAEHTDFEAEFYRTKAAQLAIENDRLKKQVAHLEEKLLMAQKHHELDYQLWLLREKNAPRPRPDWPSGNGYKAVAEKVSSSFQRKPKTRKPTPEPVMVEDPESEDFEIMQTLRHLYDESIRDSMTPRQEK